jgi:hypothetical protein
MPQQQQQQPSQQQPPQQHQPPQQPPTIPATLVAAGQVVNAAPGQTPGDDTSQVTL